MLLSKSVTKLEDLTVQPQVPSKNSQYCTLYLPFLFFNIYNFEIFLCIINACVSRIPLYEAQRHFLSFSIKYLKQENLPSSRLICRSDGDIEDVCTRRKKRHLVVSDPISPTNDPNQGYLEPTRSLNKPANLQPERNERYRGIGLIFKLPQGNFLPGQLKRGHNNMG